MNRIVLGTVMTSSRLRLGIRRMSASSDKGDSSLSNYMSSWRLKAAEALTSTMSPEDRSKLFPEAEKPEDTTKQPTTDSLREERSIAEKIAEARLQAVAEVKEDFERKREEIQAEAEEAAKKAVEVAVINERRRVQYDLWKAQQEQVANAAKESTPVEQTSADPLLSDHPVLGRMLADLGSKKIFLAPVENLVHVDVWKRQRSFNYKRTQAMVKDKLKTLHLGLPGIICVVEDENGQLSIVDGQHRVGMLQQLRENRKAKDFDFDNILVEVYPSGDSDTTANEIFVEVNKAQPVKEIDMPGSATEHVRETITAAVSRLQETFPKMFSNSQRRRKPHVNYDNIRDALFTEKILERYKLKDESMLYEWILGRNQSLAAKYTADSACAEFGIGEQVLQKAIDNDFFLGLDNDWLKS